jgi:diguanylate cyclase (GGDEF)-like protein
MSFRARLTSFFVVIVVLPMLGVGLLVFKLIGQSAQGKADARANGLATAGASLYQSESAEGRADAVALARGTAGLQGPALRAAIATLSERGGLMRVTVTRGGHREVDVGDRTAIAPGIATARSRAGAAATTIAVSSITAAQYAHKLSSPTVGVVVRQGSRPLFSTFPAASRRSLPRQGTITLGDGSYRAVTQNLPSFGGKVEITVLSNLAATDSSVSSTRLLAALFIIGFLLLAVAFSVLASRALAGQLGRFLQAARRLAGGDFSAPVPTVGHDEFAALGDEFNRMSRQLANRIDELAQERARLRESIRRIGQTFASNLDRHALLRLSLNTLLDAVQASSGRLTSRATSGEPLGETVRVGDLTGIEEHFLEAERSALRTGGLGEVSSGELVVAAISLGPFEDTNRTHGIITVARKGRPFTDDDRDLLRLLGSQTTLALENVQLHVQVQQQAVTDELTGLANHGHFHEMLGHEVEQVRRYGHAVGLIMLDLDDFKSVNDTFGHQQGDAVLRHVARVLRENSREVDVPARYGGEEMALILPHTDLEGAYAIAERVRAAIEASPIRRLDGNGQLHITASAGVAASTLGRKDSLIADADAALYAAKRRGKNRTVRAQPQTANVSGAE